MIRFENVSKEYIDSDIQLKKSFMYCTPKVRHKKSNFWGVFL